MPRAYEISRDSRDVGYSMPETERMSEKIKPNGTFTDDRIMSGCPSTTSGERSASATAETVGNASPDDPRKRC